MSNTVLSSWERRGHTRKPNAIVRGIYGCLDWIGDFGYLTKSMKQGTGHFLIVTVSTLITLSILIASTIHSIELLERAGLHSGLQYIMLLPFEVLFLASSSALNKAISQKNYFPLWPWAGFIVSLVFIWRSNVIGLADNIDGQVLAWLTPFLLLISKGLLAWNIKNRKAEPTKQEATPSVSNEKPEEKATKIEVENNTVLTDDNDQKIETVLTENTTEQQPEIIDEVTNKLTENTTTDLTQNADDNTELVKAEQEEETTSKSNEEKPEKTSDFEKKVTTDLTQNKEPEADQEQPETQGEIAPTTAVEIVDSDQPKEDKVASLEVVKNQPEKTTEDIKEWTEIIAQKIPAKSRERKKSIEKTARMALRFYTQKGKTPTRDELIAKAKCSQNIAKDVLKEVKQLTSKVS